MHDKEIWTADETRSRMWRLIKDAGWNGTTRKTLMEQMGKSSTSVDWHLTNLVRDDYAEHCLGTGRSWRRVRAGPKLPPIAGLVLDLALAAIDDCPAGMSSEMLCGVVGCGPHELQRALQPAEHDGRIERIVMPMQHGGGLGWRQGTPAVLHTPARLGPAELLHEHVHMLPVVEVDIDRIHHVRNGELFECDMSEGRLRVTSGALTMTLSAAQTGKLLAYLRHLATEAKP